MKLMKSSNKDKYLPNKSEFSFKSLHEDITDVINTMGPLTPLVPGSMETDSGDDTTISSNNYSHASNRTTNSSFVEVIIKNHHRKCKVMHENLHELNKPQHSSVFIQTDNDFSIKELVNNASENEIKESKVDINETKDIKVISPFKTNVFPQRFFNVGIWNKKQKENIIELNPSKDVSRKNTNDCTQGFASTNNSEKKSYTRIESENELKTEYPQGKTELYYFDRGNFTFFNTTDYPPVIMADHLAEKTENTAVRFWAETFGIANVALAFVTTFILQLIRFFLFGVVRPMTAGVIQLLSDYLVKPLLASVFNGLIQPPLIFVFNILSSFRDVCEPIAQMLHLFTREIAVVFASFRLFEIKKNESSMV